MALDTLLGKHSIAYDIQAPPILCATRITCIVKTTLKLQGPTHPLGKASLNTAEHVTT
jgi:hypothetical protein